MTPTEFLRAVWPDDGFYCIAVKLEHGGYWHTVHHTVEQAAEFVAKHRDNKDIYFCIHSLKEEQVWNPRKRDPKTGEMGAWSIRTKPNMREARVFFFDLDVGQGEGKYPSVGAAVNELWRFCNEALLPTPMIVKSGGGVHVYWVLEDSIQTHQWAVYAERLRALAEAHDFMVDPARTTDTASILRVAGTYNLKTGTPRPVEVKLEGSVTPTEEFIYMLTRACEEAGVKADDAKPATTVPLNRPAHLQNVEGGNLDEKRTFKPVEFGQLIECPQARWAANTEGSLDYPAWRCWLSIFNCIVDGEQFCREWSELSDQFDEVAFENTMANLSGPYHCSEVAKLCGGGRCDGCVLNGKGRTPLQIADYAEAAPPPQVTIEFEGEQIVIDVPNPPEPYIRRDGGGIIRIAAGTKTDRFDELIYEFDLFPVAVITNEESELEQSRWRVNMGEKRIDFTIDADALYDGRKFTQTIAHKGVYPDHSKVGKLQAYMVAYVKQLRAQAEAEAQHNRLGWANDYKSFILPDRIFHADGTVKPAHLSKNALRTCDKVGRAGTLEKQVELMQFYNRKEYLANQFMILCALAAPILHLTGHFGAIVNASGEAGSSKSTTLYTAASLWGVPQRLPINGTNSGATMMARNNYITVLSNIPVCVDEITHIPPKEASNMAMNISQAEGRIRMGPDGVQRPAPESMKSTIMLATANTSLHALLSLDNASGTAGSMRVLEIAFAKARAEMKHEADRFLSELAKNYGHIGPAFIHNVVQRMDELGPRMLATSQQFDSMCGIAPSERFWSAVSSAALTAGEIAVEQGLLPFDMLRVRNWIINTLIPAQRGVIASQYATPLGVLTEFLEQINHQILVTTPVQGEATDNVLRDIHGQLSGHFDTKSKTLWVMKKVFKDYCVKIGANYLNVLNELNKRTPGQPATTPPIVSSTAIKKVLGARTRHAKAQSPCFVVNMDHPELTGVVEERVAPAAAPVVFSEEEMPRIQPKPVSPPEPAQVVKLEQDPAARTGKLPARFNPFIKPDEAAS